MYLVRSHKGSLVGPLGQLFSFEASASKEPQPLSFHQLTFGGFGVSYHNPWVFSGAEHWGRGGGTGSRVGESSLPTMHGLRGELLNWCCNQKLLFLETSKDLHEKAHNYAANSAWLFVLNVPFPGTWNDPPPPFLRLVTDSARKFAHIPMQRPETQHGDSRFFNWSLNNEAPSKAPSKAFSGRKHLRIWDKDFSDSPSRIWKKPGSRCALISGRSSPFQRVSFGCFRGPTSLCSLAPWRLRIWPRTCLGIDESWWKHHFSNQFFIEKTNPRAWWMRNWWNPSDSLSQTCSWSCPILLIGSCSEEVPLLGATFGRLMFACLDMCRYANSKDEPKGVRNSILKIHENGPFFGREKGFLQRRGWRHRRTNWRAEPFFLDVAFLSHCCQSDQTCGDFVASFVCVMMLSVRAWCPQSTRPRCQCFHDGQLNFSLLLRHPYHPHPLHFQAHPYAF